MPPFSLRTFLNPRPSLINCTHNKPPFPSIHCRSTLLCAPPYPFSPSLFFFLPRCLHLALGLEVECPGGFVFSFYLSYWPFPSRYTSCAHTHTHTQIFNRTCSWTIYGLCPWILFLFYKLSPRQRKSPKL